MRHVGTFSLVCLLRLTNPCALFLSSSSTTVLLATVIGVSVIQAVDASDATEKGTLSAGKLRSLGEVAMSERKFDEAASYYSQAIEVEPNVASNYYKLYSVHKRMRSLNSALNDITKAVELDGTKADWRIQKAKLLVNLGRCEEATLEYSEAGKLLAAGSGNEKKIQENSNAQQESDTCAQMTKSAMVAYQSEKWPEAVAHFNKVLSYTLDTPDLLYMKAQSEYHTKDYYGVVSDTGKILKNYPKHIEAYQLRGEAYSRLNEMEMAVKHFREGLKMDPEHKGTSLVWIQVQEKSLVLI